MIKTLSGIRFYLFLLVFLTHIKDFIKISELGAKCFNFFNWGSFAVTFFFILSGFCITLGYIDKFKDSVNLKKLKSFYTKRFIKNYPLYIITGLFCLFFFFLPHNTVWGIAFVFLYIPMISTFSIWKSGGGNEAGWFLQALFFCYLICPFLLIFINKIRNKLNYIHLLAMLAFWMILSFVIWKMIFNDSFYVYLYHFPIARLPHFAFGMFLAVIYKQNLEKLILEDNLNKYIESLFDIVLILATLFLVIKLPKTYIVANCIYVPLIMLIILYVCFIKHGILYKLLTNKITLFLADLSLECYLIHYVLVTYCSNNFNVYIESSLGITYYCIVMLFYTVLISLVYKPFQNKTENFFMNLLNSK